MNHHRSRRQRVVALALVAAAVIVLTRAPGAGAAGPTAKFSIGSGSSVVAGFAVSSFTVNAVDAAGALTADYRGTVHFTSSDPLASLPPDYTFTATDNGTHVFAGASGLVILKTPGSQTVTITDVANSAITGTRTVNVTSASAIMLAVGTEPFDTTVGQPVAVTVSARGSGGGVASNYRGTIHFTSTDPQAQLPADYTFAVADAGVHRFLGVMFKTVGASQTITVTDNGTPPLVGTSNPVQVTNPLASAFQVGGSAAAFVDGLGVFTVSAVDTAGKLATSYRGTVHFTSTDAAAVLPADHTFTASDAGTLTDVTVTFKTVGTHIVTVTDIIDPSIRGVSPQVVVTLNQLPTTTTTPGATTTTAASNATTTTAVATTMTAPGSGTAGAGSTATTTAAAATSGGAAGTGGNSTAGAGGTDSGGPTTRSALARTGLPVVLGVTVALLCLGFGGAALRERQRRSLGSEESSDMN